MDPVGSADLDHHEQDAAAARAAGDGSRGTQVDAHLGEQSGVATAAADAARRCHLLVEELIKRPGDRVAVECLHRAQPPVGPNRSVLICMASCPALTSSSAIASTNPVGPQT